MSSRSWRGAARAPGLVVDELVVAVGQAIDAVHAPAQGVGAQAEAEGLLEPQRLAVLLAEALVVAAQGAVGLGVQLALLVGGSEAAAPPADREHPPAVGGARRPTVGLEHDVVAHGVGLRSDRTGRLRGLRVGVDPHGGEVVAQADFHEPPGRRVERLASTRAHDVLDGGAPFGAGVFVGQHSGHAGVAGGALEMQHRGRVERAAPPGPGTRPEDPVRCPSGGGWAVSVAG